MKEKNRLAQVQDSLFLVRCSNEVTNKRINRNVIRAISDANVEKRKKLRRIEIKTRKLSNQIFSGSYHSAFKGRGISFSEVREYQFGDDLRTIDWNVTARSNKPFIKVFEEERELTMMLLIDVSQSSFFGTQTEFKNHI